MATGGGEKEEGGYSLITRLHPIDKSMGRRIYNRGGLGRSQVGQTPLPPRRFQVERREARRLVGGRKYAHVIEDSGPGARWVPPRMGVPEAECEFYDMGRMIMCHKAKSPVRVGG